MENSYKLQSLARKTFNGLPNPLGPGCTHVVSFSVARVRPRTSKGITDLLLLHLVWLNATCPSKKSNQSESNKRIRILFSRPESRSLSELTRQIAPPTKNGHAPPSNESRKSYQSVNPTVVRTGWVFPCWVKLSRRLHSWWCPSVNSFKFQICNHTSPGIQKFWFPGGCPTGHGSNTIGSLIDIVYGQNYDGIWSSSNLWLSFLINENILGKCFRFSTSYGDPRISPLTA